MTNLKSFFGLLLVSLLFFTACKKDSITPEILEDNINFDDFDDCFTFVYPIQVQFPEGEMVNYDNKEDLNAGIGAWFNANPESEEDPLPVFPFDVNLEDGTTQTMSNEMEVEALLESC